MTYNEDSRRERCGNRDPASASRLAYGNKKLVVASSSSSQLFPTWSPHAYQEKSITRFLSRA